MSKSAPAIPFFGDAYLADTRHLSLEEHGAYLQLLMIAWRSDGCRLPNDDDRIARMLGITGARWRKLKPTVMAFWQLQQGHWYQGRLIKERQFVDEKRAKNSASANARWEAKSPENKQDGECERIYEGNAPPPSPTEEEGSEDKSSGTVVPHPAADFCKAVFDSGVSLLTGSGTTEKAARSLIGRWRKSLGDPEIMTLIRDAEGKSDPGAWITAAVATRSHKHNNGADKYVSESGHVYQSGNPETVMREAEKRADWTTYYSAKSDMEGNRGQERA